MIYRYSSSNNKDLIMQKMSNGEQVDYDKLWVEEKQDERGERIDTGTIYHPDDDLDAEFYFYMTLGGLITAGILPVVDTAVHEIKTIQKKHFEKIDSKRDIIAVSASEVLFFADKIKAKASQLLKQGHKVNVVVDGCAQTESVDANQRVEYYYDTQKLLRLLDLEYELKQLGMTEPLKFNEFFQTTAYSDLKTCWDLEDVIEANNKIDKVVSRIQNLKLSPYETMVYIHKFLTSNFGYGFHTSKIKDKIGVSRNTEKNRSIVAALQDNKTVCAGYASLTKAIIDRLNNPQIKCEYQNASCWSPTKKDSVKYRGGHALSLITIEDPKYNINGSYLNDATWDSKTKKQPYGRGYTYFMYPVTDMSKLKKTALRIASGSRTKLDSYSIYYWENPSKGVDCKPIPFDTFEKAVKQVYSLEKDFCQGDEPEQAATQDIQLSLRRAWDSRIDDANPLVKQVEVVYKVRPSYNRNHKLKNVKFELVNQAINVNKEADDKNLAKC